VYINRLATKSKREFWSITPKKESTMTSRIGLWTVALLRGPFCIRRLAVLTLVFATLAGLGFSAQATAKKPKPLSEKEVLELLRGDVPNTRMIDLANEKGIDFEITPDIAKKLREAGATQELIEALVKARKGNKEEAKPQSGNLKVKTKPGEAQVYLSDEFKGLTSPEGELRVPSIPPGDYRLRVSKVGYQTWEDQVTVSSAETETVFVTLDQTSSESVAEKPTLPRSTTEPLRAPVLESPAVPALRPITLKLAPTLLRQLVVPARDYVAITFKVDPAMQQARVVGSFRASGGWGNDIQIVLADQAQFENLHEILLSKGLKWLQRRVLYATAAVTNGQINVPISQAGTYYLVFNNLFSLLSAKQVFAEVELRYLAAQ